MDLQQNTEFVLQKIDSLVQGALPFIQKGGEEVIKYKVIEYRAEYLSGVIGFLVLSFILIKATIWLIKKGKELEELDEAHFARPIIIFSILSVFSVCGLVITMFDKSVGFILSFTSPELFAIMQLIGK